MKIDLNIYVNMKIRMEWSWLQKIQKKFATAFFSICQHWTLTRHQFPQITFPLKRTHTFLCANINWTFHITQKCDDKAAICHYGTYTIRQRYLFLSPKCLLMPLHVTLFSAIATYLLTRVYKVHKLSFNTFFKSHMDVIYDVFPPH